MIVFISICLHWVGVFFSGPLLPSFAWRVGVFQYHVRIGTFCLLWKINAYYSRLFGIWNGLLFILFKSYLLDSVPVLCSWISHSAYLHILYISEPFLWSLNCLRCKDKFLYSSSVLSNSTCRSFDSVRERERGSFA